MPKTFPVVLLSTQVTGHQCSVAKEVTSSAIVLPLVDTKYRFRTDHSSSMFDRKE